MGPGRCGRLVTEMMVKTGAMRLYSLLLTTALCGCVSASPPVVAPGDTVTLSFTCRLPNGQLAVATDPGAGAGTALSPVFTKRHTTAPLRVVVEEGYGEGEQSGKLPDPGAFETDVSRRLASQLTGRKSGDQLDLELRAERFKEQPGSKQTVSIAKVRQRPKELRMTPAAYKERTGVEAAPEQPFANDPALPGRVVSVTRDEVLIRFAPKTPEVQYPFGIGIIRDKNDHYEIDIQAQPGALVRTGGLVGRITGVDDRSISIDYGHPFGGEALNCRVKIDGVEPGRKRDAVSGATPAAALDPQAEKLLNEGMAKMVAAREQGRGENGVAGNGDLVTANYTLSLDDGSLVATTVETVAHDKAVKKVSWYRQPASYGPQELVAGKREIMPGLAEALVGMKPGEKKHVTLAPKDAFGAPDPAKNQRLPFSQTFPVTIRMPAAEYTSRFGSFPVVNKEVAVMPHIKFRVSAVTERDVALEFQTKNGSSFEEEYGTVSIAVADGKITMTLRPKVGAPFPLKEGAGIITGVDGTGFTVDMNHPLAGKSVVMELEALTVAAASQAAPIQWMEDHDAGLERAKKEHKPALLILHADWCSWCKKTFSDVMTDPRITALRDRFVWIRVNSDQQTAYKQRYRQEGFPMIVLFRADGAEARKSEGFQDVAKLRAALRELL